MNEIHDRIEQVVDRILDDYKCGRDIDQMDMRKQPDKDVVVDIIEKLRRIVFPACSRDKNFRVYNLKHNLSMLIEDVMSNLIEQVSLVFQGAGETEEAAASHARQVSLTFFEKIPQIRAVVQTDVQAFFDGDPAATGTAEIIFAYPGLYAIVVNRLAHILYELNVPMIPRIMTEHAHSVTGIDIHPGATIGEFFFIDHGTGIVIGETTVIGDNVKIYQGVTLGGLSTRGGQSLRGKRRHPTIESNVTIYANASILGGETVIGQGSVIGASAFITKSVEPNTTVSMKDGQLQLHRRTGACETCLDPCFDVMGKK